SFTPTLAAMLRDPLLLRRFDEHRRRLRRLLEREAARHAGHERLAGLTAMYQERLDRAERLFEENGRDLVAAFGRIAEGGRLEIFGSCATHGLLPLLAEPPEAVQAQVRVGIEEHRRAFGRPPRGFWLPECGIGPGVAEALATEGVRYTVVEQHGVLHADPRPRYGVYAPV